MNQRGGAGAKDQAEKGGRKGGENRVQQRQIEATISASGGRERETEKDKAESDHGQSIYAKCFRVHTARALVCKGMCKRER